jgi:hypothetical protein
VSGISRNGLRVPITAAGAEALLAELVAWVTAGDRGSAEDAETTDPPVTPDAMGVMGDG